MLRLSENNLTEKFLKMGNILKNIIWKGDIIIAQIFSTLYQERVVTWIHKVHQILLNLQSKNINKKLERIASNLDTRILLKSSLVSFTLYYSLFYLNLFSSFGKFIDCPYNSLKPNRKPAVQTKVMRARWKLAPSIKRIMVRGAIHRVCTDTFGTPSHYVIMVITRPIGSSALATHELAARILDHTGEQLSQPSMRCTYENHTMKISLHGNKKHLPEWCFSKFCSMKVRKTLYSEPVTSVVHVRINSFNRCSFPQETSPCANKKKIKRTNGNLAIKILFTLISHAPPFLLFNEYLRLPTLDRVKLNSLVRFSLGLENIPEFSLSPKLS
ncbi:hypothetical protein E2986_12711 [Frieseomelitta varia]|uniref:Uncharacterized protein n=1 Tax=Frieseomelitta varia TaxID=561572 RepID=A0A833RZC6_9HYME|nr:hypothetical protein E2986_12711 [Frieseomelitta varia]